MNIQFMNQKEWGIEPSFFDPLIDRLRDYVNFVEGDLNVIFVNDEEIHRLNLEYRQKDKPTDVLSFPYLEAPDFEQTGLIGEIYISVPTAKKQAEKQNDRLEDELSKLFVHGFLHVFGHDHELEDEYKKMYDIECAVLKRKLPFIPREEMA